MDFGAVLRQTPMAGFRQKTKMRIAATSLRFDILRGYGISLGKSLQVKTDH